MQNDKLATISADFFVFTMCFAVTAGVGWMVLAPMLSHGGWMLPDLAGGAILSALLTLGFHNLSRGARRAE